MCAVVLARSAAAAAEEAAEAAEAAEAGAGAEGKVRSKPFRLAVFSCCTSASRFLGCDAGRAGAYSVFQKKKKKGSDDEGSGGDDDGEGTVSCP